MTNFCHTRKNMTKLALTWDVNKLVPLAVRERGHSQKFSPLTWDVNKLIPLAVREHGHSQKFSSQYMDTRLMSTCHSRLKVRLCWEVSSS
jgi:hypothetical protein